MEAVEWAVLRHPERGQPTHQPGVFAIPTTGSAWGALPVVIYYSYDEEVIVYESIRRAN
jgi:hypothetical protein